MAKRGRAGDPARRQQWQELLERWRQSGQTVREFCRVAEVKESAFYWWRRALSRSRPKPNGGRRASSRPLAGEPRRKSAAEMSGPARSDKPAGAGFLPLQVVLDRAGEPSSGVEIHWSNGCSVRLMRGFDRQTLVEVLSELEARPC
jgi:hypothetical protein